MLPMEKSSYSYFWWCGYSQDTLVSFVMIFEFSERTTRFFIKKTFFIFSQPIFLILPYFFQLNDYIIKIHKLDSFELYSCLQLYQNFVGWKSFLESNYPGILTLCKTNLKDASDFSNFNVRGYLLLIQEDSVTHMLGVPDNVKEGLRFAQDLSLENCEDS